MFRCLVLKISMPGENGYSFQRLATCTCTCGISSAAEVQGYYMYMYIRKILMANLVTVVENLTPELCTCTMYMYMYNPCSYGGVTHLVTLQGTVP